MKRAIPVILAALLALSIAYATPSVDSFKGKTVLGSIVELSWTVSDSENALDYLELYKGAQFLKKFTLTGGKYSDIYNDDSAKPGEKYTYKIIVYNTNGNKAESLMDVTVDNIAPKLTSPKSFLTSQKTITIETDENSICEAGFKLGSINASNLTMLEGKQKSHPLTLAFAEGQNTVLVMCADESMNEFAKPEEITVIYDTTKPSKPVLAADKQGDIVKLSWQASTDSSGIKEYKIYRSPDGKVFDEIKSLALTSYEEPLQSTTYYAVGAIDNAGNEERSDVKLMEVKVKQETAPLIQSAGIADLPAKTAAKTGKKFPFSILAWAFFLVIAVVALLMYFRKKQDKFGLESYLSRRSRMR